jgi:hypothetical protein
MEDDEAAIKYTQEDLDKRMGNELFQYLLRQSTPNASRLAVQEH